MAQSMKFFTQSIRLLDPVNQKRIKQGKRILWPDYEILDLLQKFQENSEISNTEIQLTNLFLYCSFEENFLIKKITKKNYLNLEELYSNDFSHLAFWIGKSVNQSLKNKQNQSSFSKSKSLEKRRQKLIFQPLNSQSKKQEPIYVILSERPLAVDQIIKTQHKVCISIAPLSAQKFLWGGSLNYQQFQSYSKDKPEQSGLFKTGGQSFGYKIDSTPKFGQKSYRKSNGLIDKRQQRYSNYFNERKEQLKTAEIEKKRKQCRNKINILPQHIRQHREMLYIQLELDNNSQLPEKADEYKIISINIYGRHLKPKYGGIYEKQSSSQESDQDFNELKGALNKYKKLLKQQIFLVYSLPFMQFNSYLQSQLNFQQNQQLRQITFRGSCLMFSAMKKLQLKSFDKSQGHSDENKNEQNSSEKHKKQKYLTTEDEQTIFINKQTLLKNNSLHKDQAFIKLKNQDNIFHNHSNVQNAQIFQSQKDFISVLPQHFDFYKKQTAIIKRQLIQLQKEILIQKLRNKFFLIGENNVEKQQEIYVPVFNPQGFQPLRIGIDRKIFRFLNPLIQDSVTKVFVQRQRIKKQYKKDRQGLTTDKNNKRLSIYVSKKRNDSEREGDLVGIDVFLTDKVYKQETVYLLIDLIGMFSNKLSALNKSEENQLSCRKLFRSFMKIQQFKNLLILLQDIKGQQKYHNHVQSQVNCQQGDVIGQVKVLLWMELFEAMNQQSTSQLAQIRYIQKLAYQLVQKEFSSSQDHKSQQEEQYLQHQKQLYTKEQQVMSRIKDYHFKYTMCQNQQQNDLLRDYFIYFFSDQHLNEQSSLFTYLFGMIKNDLNNEQESKSNIKQIKDCIEEVLNEFLLMNCKFLMDAQNKNLNSVIERIYKNVANMNGSYQQNRQIHFQTYLFICKVLKSSITYVLENIATIPINIFLSEPVEQFYITEQNNQFGSGNTKTFDCTQLRQFLKRHFIKGHNFLQRQAENSQLDSDNLYMSLVTDLLSLIIKVENTKIHLDCNFRNSKSIRDKEQVRMISNVYQLINRQYQQCLSTNEKLLFEKINSIQKDDLFSSEKLCQFNRIQGQKLPKEIVQLKYNEILNNQKQWYLNNLSFMVNPHYTQNTLQFKALDNLNKANTAKNDHTKQQAKKLVIRNPINKPIKLSINPQYQAQTYNFTFTISHSNNQYKKLTDSNQKYQIVFSLLQNHPLLSFKEQQKKDFSYSVDLIRTHLGLNYRNYQKTIQNFISDNKSLFNCYEVFVELEIITQNNRSKNNPNLITLKSSNVFLFENFKNSRTTKNNILFNLSDKEQQVLSYLMASQIHQINIKIFSKKLPILSASLSFINIRLKKHLKNMSKKSQSQLKQSNRKSISKSKNRKTIGSRYTQHLNNRKSTHAIEQNIFEGSSNYNLNSKSTLLNLPQSLLFDILRVDKSYISDQEQILCFIDQFYEQNEPQYEDYILYSCQRPNFMRMSAILRHYFANKIKYEQSKILNNILKTKLNSLPTIEEKDLICELIIKKPRISSCQPQKNILDTNQQRQLLKKYMEDLTRKKSLNKQSNSQSMNSPKLFMKKTVFSIKQQRKQNQQEFQI